MPEAASNASGPADDTGSGADSADASSAARENETARQNIIGFLSMGVGMMVPSMSTNDMNCIASSMLKAVSADDIAAMECLEPMGSQELPPQMQAALGDAMGECLSDEQLAEFNQNQRDFASAMGGN